MELGPSARGCLCVLCRLQYWALSLLVFPAVTLFGNMLVCLSVFTERTLHTITNYFIVSLAVADIMVAVLVMPLAVYVEVCLIHRPLKPCPHCRRKVQLSQKTARQRRIRRQSHFSQFSATMWTGFYI